MNLNFLNPLLKGLLDSLYNFSGSYGVAVILLSLFIMVITFPLNLKQMQFTKTMQLLKPETEEIKKKYKGDKEKINQATAELWQKYNINPAMGCLPLLIQFPVLIAMFSVLQTPGLFDAAPMFLGLNLNLPGTVIVNGEAITQTIGALPWVYWILPALSVITTFLQSYQITPMDDPSQRTMLYVMPIFMGYITIRFPTALALYWVSRNVFTIGQQYIFTTFKAPRLVEGEADTGDKRGKNR